MSGQRLDTNCAYYTYDTIPGLIMDMSNHHISDLTGLKYINPYSSQRSSGADITLNLSHNSFTRIPNIPMSWFHWLSSYGQLLDLSYNSIDSVKLGSENQYINKLNVSHNGLHYFNYDSGYSAVNFLYLRNLNLNYNNIDTFRPSLGIPFGTNTYSVSLHLRHNRINNDLFVGNLDTLDVGANFISGSKALRGYTLICDSNMITNMRILGDPNGYLLGVDCSHNRITDFYGGNRPYQYSQYPASWFMCNDNNLSYLPYNLSFSWVLDCHNNPNLSCLTPLPFKSSFYLNIDSTNITCLPNRYASCTYTGSANLLTLPICNYAFSNCSPYHTIEGILYADDNHNCIKDSLERPLSNLPILFYNGGSYSQTISSDDSGHYGFTIADTGWYSLSVDTLRSTACFGSGGNSINFSYNSPTPVNINCGLSCKPGYDLGIAGEYNERYRIGRNVNVTINAGDMSHAYGLNCGHGMGGTVRLILSGPVSYNGTIGGPQSPNAVSGDTIIWNVNNFDSMAFYTSFNATLLVDSSATIGSQICLTAVIDPIAGDMAPANNIETYCGIVRGGYDPNEKRVSPPGAIPQNQDWLTYTIDFQNTGNDTAYNIYVMDTLDVAHVDASSFQFLNASAHCVPQVSEGRIARFSFPHIDLVDSLHNEPMSHGWIQYKVKTKANLALNNQIKNTASIYFDLNPAVRTNTTVNTVSLHTGIETVSETAVMHLYPNPNSGSFTLETANQIGQTYIITDMLGQIVQEKTITSDRQHIDMSTCAPGIYTLILRGKSGAAIVMVR